MTNMIKPRKRTSIEKLSILETLFKSGNYSFPLVGKKPPYISLKELGGTTFENYYIEQAQKYNKHFEAKKPDLKNYCCLYTYKLKKSIKVDPNYLTEKDKEYAMKTVIILDAIVNQKFVEVKHIKESKSIDAKKQDSLENIYNEIVGYVRAISTLSATDFEPTSIGKRKKKQEIEEAKRTLALYGDTGAITKN